jgi:hypothetical protein
MAKINYGGYGSTRRAYKKMMRRKAGVSAFQYGFYKLFGGKKDLYSGYIK